MGESVGYAIRFDDRVTDTTAVKLMTDGILLAEMQRDRFLKAYDTIIIDEAHERSLKYRLSSGLPQEAFAASARSESHHYLCNH